MKDLEREELKEHKNTKKIKALEIIKEKKVDICELYCCFEMRGLETYNSSVIKGFGEKPLTQEEYDLLKEVLL